MAYPTYPVAVDCLAGTVPTLPAMINGTSSNAYWQSRLIYFQRMADDIKSGSVLFLGDSLTDAMSLGDVCPYGVNFGIGGETTRQLVNRINQTSISGTPNPIRRAGATVILIGINDLVNELAIGNTRQQAIDNTLYCWSNKLLPWLTGPLVVCKLLPVADGIVQNVDNAYVNAVNAGLASLLAGRANTAVVDVSAQLAPQGQLLSTYHIGDGLHLSGAGYAILKPALQAALSSLGIG